MEKELPQKLLLSIQKIIDGNHVKSHELIHQQSTVYPFKFTVTVTWHFDAEWNNEWIAGGRAADIHSGYDLDHFNQRHQTHLKDVQQNTNRRYTFISQLENLNVSGLAHNHKTALHHYPTHSYHYNCQSCRGNGKQNCSGCHGRGYQNCGYCHGTGAITEYRNGDTFRVRCYHCQGSGDTRCYRCSGSGVEECSNCTGYGYFTYYRSTSLMAYPKNYYQLNCAAESAQTLLDHLSSRSHQHLLEHLDFHRYQHLPQDNGTTQFVYHGQSDLTDLWADLRGISHHVVAYSNPPIPFIRSGIFDQLFVEEITALETYHNAGQKISKEKALKFFNEFCGQPVLDQALKSVAANRSATKEDQSEHIREACHYYITQESATRLADGINAILDKVSPAYHGWTWVLMSFAYFIFAGIYIEYALEQAQLYKWTSALWDSTVLIFFGLLFYLAYCIITVIISVFICSFKSRNVPKEYVQEPRNAEPFSQSMVYGTLLLIGCALYGYQAGKNNAPLAGPFLLNYVFKTADVVLPKPLVRWYCEDQNQMQLMPKEKYICHSKYFYNFDGIHVEYGQPEQAIQAYLQQDDPDLKQDGQIGPASQVAIKAYFEKRNMKFDENWNYHQIAHRMEIHKKPY